MGHIARFDTYLDVCFLALLVQCKEWNIAIPVATFIILMLIYPLTQLISLARVRKDLEHTLPYLERDTKICFIRENMLLATILDSFCVNNYVQIAKKPIVFGKIMGILTFFLQDFP